jgi:hypothetical protein
MPRVLPDLAGSFRADIDRAYALANAGEEARVRLMTSPSPRPISVIRLEQLYEMAYLRIFLGWEAFLQECFLRYICGYRNSVGQQSSVSGTFFANLSDAESAMLGNNDYVLWYKPTKIYSRVNGFLTNSLIVQVINSAQSDLEDYAAIRHRIVHAQQHAKIQFDSATANMVGKRYPGSRAGSFLREWTTVGGNQIRWLSRIGDELHNLALQIAP